MDRIGIYINESLNKEIKIKDIIGSTRCLQDVSLFCTQKQVHFMPECVAVSDSQTKLDCILVFGGDGTILSAIDYALQSNASILGINSGKLGFLSDFSSSEVNKYLPRLISGNYKKLHRMLLDVSVIRGRKVIHRCFALNDAVIYKGLVSRLINIKVICSGRFVLETRCDGMIAASPTGSTAYSLSAGGPILSPETKAFVIAALCPHVLSVRPMVFPTSDKLTFKMAKVYNETILQIDGKNVQPLVDGDSITIKEAKNKISFITLTGKSFYQTLRKKLHMGKL